ncbi:MAG: efflux RND transporter periplasmic adaptor subunit [Bacteroidetes bacterium]|nr:MAG: efflux RND transporter periplasmic adaptor subunit [Bacteroidota bacterium]
MKNLIFIYFLVLITFFSCSEEKKESAKTETAKADEVRMTDDQLKIMDIKLVTPEKKSLSSYIYLNGKVKALPNFQAVVSSDISGKIESTHVLEGDFVNKGRLLMTLRSMEVIELQNQYLGIKSEQDFLAIEFKRQQELRKSNIGALAEYQTVEAKYNAAINQEKAIRAKLVLLGINVADLQDPKKATITSTISIKAPIDGYVHKLPVKVGMLALPETILAELINVSELQADLFVYDKDINLISEGQTVELDFINASIPFAKGKVIHIERAIDPDTKAINIHVVFTATDKNLILPGMNVRAIIQNPTEEKRTPFTVPISSILQEQDHSFVFCATNQKSADGKQILKKCKVILGDKNEQFTEITFMNEMPDDILVAQNNVMVLENERKKTSGGL